MTSSYPSRQYVYDRMKISIKNLGILLVLVTITYVLLYTFSIYFDISFQEGLENGSSSPPTKTEEKKPGVYVMTNTTYDSNGNVVVKTMDTSGNFSVNTYGSTIINQTSVPPSSSQTSQETTQTNNNTSVNSRTKFLPPQTQQQEQSQSSVSSVNANDISQVAAAAAAAAAAAVAKQ